MDVWHRACVQLACPVDLGLCADHLSPLLLPLLLPLAQQLLPAALRLGEAVLLLGGSRGAAGGLALEVEELVLLPLAQDVEDLAHLAAVRKHHAPSTAHRHERNPGGGEGEEEDLLHHIRTRHKVDFLQQDDKGEKQRVAQRD